MRRPGVGSSLAVGLAAVIGVIGCGGVPRPVRDAEAPLDLGPLTGSWSATVRGEGVWQGRWQLHLQGGAAILVQPDGALVVPGTIDAIGAGAVAFGPTLLCDSNVDGVRSGHYRYELTSRGLDLQVAPEGDGCADRRTVLAADTWMTAPSIVMPLRVDVRPDPSCDPPPASPDPAATPLGGTAGASRGGAAEAATPPTGLPLPWELSNETAGIVLVVDQVEESPRTLVAAATPGETVLVDPQRGGRWTVTDAAGRCLVRVAGVKRVTLRTGGPPVVEPQR